MKKIVDPDARRHPLNRPCSARTILGRTCRTAPLKGQPFCIWHHPDTKWVPFFGGPMDGNGRAPYWLGAVLMCVSCPDRESFWLLYPGRIPPGWHREGLYDLERDAVGRPIRWTWTGREVMSAKEIAYMHDPATWVDDEDDE
jgi:hypothetical protein